MPRNLPSELLFDSVSSLRSAASLLRELQHAPPTDPAEGAPPALEDKPPAMDPTDLLLRLYVDACGMLELVDRVRQAVSLDDAARTEAAPAPPPSITHAAASLAALDARIRESVALLERQLLHPEGAEVSASPPRPQVSAR